MQEMTAVGTFAMCRCARDVVTNRYLVTYR
jgi:hypothetical protein